ncbi:NYN domain-containing protein [Patescibacteria group bacterium]|nr:NYN domain-containing protein [Patescibacteria group bacterium]MBU1705473.1 NYN domain-containing protein [Patescibacteria group bacterium]
MIQNPEQRVGVFIDTQNMYYSARHLFQRKVNFKGILADAVGKRRLIRAIAYVVRTKTHEESPFFEALQKAGIETKEKELMEYLSGQKKADWDVGLTVDIIRMLDMLDVIVLVSGDGDYIPLVEYVRNRGRIVEVMAFRETTSSRLVEVVDHYTNLSDAPKKYILANARTDGGGDKNKGARERRMTF